MWGGEAHAKGGRGRQPAHGRRPGRPRLASSHVHTPARTRVCTCIPRERGHALSPHVPWAAVSPSFAGGTRTRGACVFRKGPSGGYPGHAEPGRRALVPEGGGKTPGRLSVTPHVGAKGGVRPEHAPMSRKRRSRQWPPEPVWAAAQSCEGQTPALQAPVPGVCHTPKLTVSAAEEPQ